MGPFLLDRSEHNFDIKLDVMEALNVVESEKLVDDNYSKCRSTDFTLTATTHSLVSEMYPRTTVLYIKRKICII